MSDALSERNKSTTGSSSNVRCFYQGSFQSVSNIQNVMTSVSYLSSSNTLEARFAGVNISSISGCTFQFMTGPVKIVNNPALKRRQRLNIIIYLCLALACLELLMLLLAIYLSFDMQDKPFIFQVFKTTKP